MLTICDMCRVYTKDFIREEISRKLDLYLQSSGIVYLCTDAQPVSIALVLSCFWAQTLLVFEGARQKRKTESALEDYRHKIYDGSRNSSALRRAKKCYQS